jgi:hypothetical protein
MFLERQTPQKDWLHASVEARRLNPLLFDVDRCIRGTWRP